MLASQPVRERASQPVSQLAHKHSTKSSQRSVCSSNMGAQYEMPFLSHAGMQAPETTVVAAVGYARLGKAHIG